MHKNLVTYGYLLGKDGAVRGDLSFAIYSLMPVELKMIYNLHIVLIKK